MNAIRRIDAQKAAPIAHTNDAGDTGERAGPKLPPILESAALFAGHHEILIAHEGMHYRLKITRQGKLILTK